MKASEKDQMIAICHDNIEAAEDWILDEMVSETSRLYWHLIKEVSEAWLEQNAKKKLLKRKAKQ